MKYFSIFMIVFGLFSCASAENEYQKYADAQRVKDVDFIIELMGRYFEKTGTFPFEENLDSKAIEVFVTHRKIPKAILEQTKRFPVEIYAIEELERILSKGFGEKITLPDDPQKVMTFAPNFYIYHVDKSSICVSGNLYFPRAGTELVYNSYYKYQRCGTMKQKK